MSSPKRRIETDVMKMLMSDYEVTLVNDNMQEFYVRFKGPEESASIPQDVQFADEVYLTTFHSTIRWRPMEDPRRTARPIPLQEPKHRLCEPHISPEH